MIKSNAIPDSPLHHLRVNNLEEIFRYFPQNIQELSAYVQNAKLEAEQCLTEVNQVSAENRDFNNTFYTLDAAETLLYSRRRAIETIAKTHPDPQFRQEAKACKDQLVELGLSLFCNKKIYHNYNEAFRNIMQSGEVLSSEKQDFLKWKIHTLRKEALHLEGNQYTLAQDLKIEMSQLESRFLQNIDEDTSFILVSEEELLGVPNSFIQTLKTEQGKKRVTCRYTHYRPVMRYCTVEKTRHTLFQAFENRAFDKNTEILKELIRKRDQFARLAGFANYAELDISDQLAQTPAAVETFVLSLKDGIQAKYNSEIEQLTQKFPEGTTLDKTGKIKPWDVMYLQEQYKKQHCHVDELALQQYFPFKRTLQQIFRMFEEMFALDIELIDTQDKALWGAPGWVIAVKDKLNQNRLAGHILIDPFPREGKFPHGYCFDALSPCKLPNGTVNPAIVLLMLNFTPPTEKRESILLHDEVVVLIHEFGHAFHQLLGIAEMPSKCGYHTQGDALEWPSRLAELLMWEKGRLKTLGKHYETGESIPEELLDAKISSKNIASGVNYMKFFGSSLFSLKCFLGGVEDPHLLKQAIDQDFLQGISCDPSTHGEASFLHLAEHFYRSKYYVYFWADVFAFDTYERIIKMLAEGTTDAWLQFRNLVLDHGGGINANEAAFKFLGRPPSKEAYLKKITKEKG